MGSRGVQVEVKATWRASISALVQTAVMLANLFEEATVYRIGICVAFLVFSNKVIPHGAEAGFQIRVSLQCVKFRTCDRSHDFDGKLEVEVGAIGVTAMVA
jgi:hypothetical protein